MKAKTIKLDDLLNKELKKVAREMKLNDSAFIRKAIMELISRYEMKKEIEKNGRNR